MTINPLVQETFIHSEMGTGKLVPFSFLIPPSYLKPRWSENGPRRNQMRARGMENIPLPENAPSGSMGMPPELQPDTQVLCAQKVQKLCGLVQNAENSSWQIGDLVEDLTANENKTLADLSSATGWKISRLSAYRSTCNAFPSESRDFTRPFYDYEKVKLAVDRVAKDAEAHIKEKPSVAIQEALKPFAARDYVKAMDLIIAEEATPKKNKKGKLVLKKLDKRETTKFLAKLAREAVLAVTPTPNPEQTDPYLDRTYHCKNEELLQKWLDEKVELKFRLIHCDAPYGKYEKFKDGHLDQNSSASAFTGADHMTREEAIQTTADTIRLLPPFLQTGGTIMLWQSCATLPMKVLAAIEESGLEVEICLTWIKPIPQPQDFKSGWTRQTEHCYVIRRKGEDTLNHNLSGRSNVLEHWFDGPVNLLDPDAHWWRKPASLMEFVIKKTTNPGENVLDLFACTGSCSKAAIKLNRRFVYVESYEENFVTNAPIVLGELEASQKAQQQSEAGDETLPEAA